ncbi:MAG: dihydroxyacetone kinase subunit L [Planctomycetes bacterium]|nr:dihydroxyacetone kinase subunit L [Planctomycetota bacterium]MBL7008761.1 dihydroxyacetone kinase subunit L [Planctomycetota bacterium]
MTDSIDCAAMAAMLRHAAGGVREHEGELSRLDSFGGDGDHGTTMVRAMAQLEGAIDGVTDGSLRTLLNDVGWAIMGTDGGATGPLFGSLFMAMGEAAPETGAVEADGVAAMFSAGLAGVRQNTRAQLGDKTVIDALVPAVEALEAAAADGGSIGAALEAAAAAAEAGAASTSDMAARFGRAKNIGERSKGAQDPGATSISLIFRGLCEGAKTCG